MPIRTPKRLRMALVAASLRVGTTGCVTAADQMMMMSREQGAGRPDRALRIYEKYNKKGFERSNSSSCGWRASRTSTCITSTPMLIAIGS